jgi:EAL domain-containing protein (putative c-di-GMP-specific phosphodiesterase class I)
LARPDRSRTFAAGAWIFREGEHGGSAYLVTRGRVKIATRRGGAERTLAEMGPGDVFGEVALIDAGPRSADAVALADTDLVEIRSESLATTLRDGDPLVPLILRVLAERFREAQGRVGAPGGEPPRALPPGSAFEALRRCALERVRHEDALRAAIAAGELELHYQPIVSLASGMLAGFEALVRWRSPSHGLVSPSEFVQLAERTGLIGELGAFVLSEAMRTHASWLADFRRAFPNEPLPYMGVNVSPAQLRTDAARALLVEALRSGSVEPGLVRLELTESLLVADPGLAKELLTELKSLGVSLAIDDFGTGYSSLRALCDFPFDTLKIDKSFVDGIPEDEDSVRVVRSVAALARELRMTVVAEGIEDDVQAERLAELGCRYGQGYRFAKPAPRAETLELLRSATTW